MRVLLTALLVGAVASAVLVVLWGPADYPGAGDGTVVVQIERGDSTRTIGNRLTERGVVASRSAFVDAARDDPRIQRVQPGYYSLRARMSGAAAAAALADGSRVGFLDVRSGTQLDDTRAPDGRVTPGVLSQIAAATCVGGVDERRCTTVDTLRRTMAGTDPSQLGVPDWARTAVARASPNRRLEGLVAPGTYDVDPTADPVVVLRTVLTDSVRRLERAGLGRGPFSYETLVRASLLEREAIVKDMPTVSRVITNRLAAGQRLELDSTVNYPLDVQALRTTAQARAAPGPYNTYLAPGLPPTPISSVSDAAVAAALAPPPGPWMFFVRCAPDGTSCFAVTFPEHQANVDRARAAGIF